MRRFVLENHCYHIATATREREPLFANSENAALLLDTLNFIRMDGTLLLAFAIMPDHLHALLAPGDNTTISRVVQSIKGYSARQINARRDRTGQLWQQGFYDRVIRDDVQMEATISYIHANPVTEGLSPTPEAYLWSSANPKHGCDLEAFYHR